jgi:formylglycine-generating enzyme
MLRSISIGLVLVCQCFFLTNASFAHPASGIVVDARGRVYFVYSGKGVVRIETSGTLTNIHEDTGGHWLALDATGAFARVTPKQFERITPYGAVPALIFASGGSPLVVGPDGRLYYGSNGSQPDALAPGAMAVARLSADGQQEIFAPLLHQKLTDLKDGITGLAAGQDGSIYVATWNGILVLDGNGSVARIVDPVTVNDCDSDPADHNPANASSPLLRGLGVDSRGNIYVAATSCHRVVKIASDGRMTSVLKSERPWSPTGVVVRGEEIYVLEYTNANGPRTEGWHPRVRKRAADGTWTTLVSVAPKVPSASSLTLHLNGMVTLDLVALPGPPTLWMGRTPVTMRQFRAFVEASGYRTDAENPTGNGPGYVGGHGWNAQRHRFEGWWPQYTWHYTGWLLTDQHPVSNVSWNDASAFCEWLSTKSGRQVRLPTATEWNRAARAGTTTVYFTGDSAASLEGYANVADRSLLRTLGDLQYASGGFPFDDGYPFTSPVGKFKPNAWGLYDMVGNVFQWCSGAVAPTLCGCSYNDGPDVCREAPGDRHAKPYSRYAYFGFRVVVEGVDFTSDLGPQPVLQ